MSVQWGDVTIKDSFSYLYSLCRDLISEYYSKKETSPAYVRSEIRYVAKSTIIVSIVLAFIHLLIIQGIISYEICRRYFYLRIGTPSLTNVFLSNYVHNPTDLSHIVDNISRFFVAAVLICIMIWYLQKKGVFFPEQFYRRTITIFLIGVPFIISFVSLISGKMQNIVYIFGFSGIVWTYIGFLLLLIALAIGTYELEIFAGLRRHYSLWSPLLFTSLLTCAVPIVFIFYLFGNHWSNMFGHLAGLFAGMMIPFLLLYMHYAKNRRKRKYSSYSHLFEEEETRHLNEL